MLSERIDRALDYQCSFSLNGSYPILSVAKKIGLKCLASIFLRKKRVELRFYLPFVDENNREIRILLETSKARKVAGVWIIYTNDSSFPELGFFRKLLENTSSVMDYCFLVDGEFQVNFRFNSIDLKEVSRALLGFVKFSELDFKINYLGESPGLGKVLSSLNSLEPLSVIEFSGLPPAEELTIENNPMGKKWVREVRFITDEDRISAIYRTDEDVDGRLYRKKIGEGIYEAYTTNSLIKAIAVSSMEKSIPTISRIQSIDGDTFDMVFVIPVAYQKHFLSVMADISERFENWHLKLSLVSSFEYRYDKVRAA